MQVGPLTSKHLFEKDVVYRDHTMLWVEEEIKLDRFPARGPPSFPRALARGQALDAPPRGADWRGIDVC